MQYLLFSAQCTFMNHGTCENMSYWWVDLTIKFAAKAKKVFSSQSKHCNSSPSSDLLSHLLFVLLALTTFLHHFPATPWNPPVCMCCLWHLTRSQDRMFDRWACDAFKSTPTLIYSVVTLWTARGRGKKRKKSCERVKERGWEEGRREEEWVKRWNMNYKPEQHHLDRENTHHSAKPAH